MARGLFVCLFVADLNKKRPGPCPVPEKMQSQRLEQGRARSGHSTQGGGGGASPLGNFPEKISGVRIVAKCRCACLLSQNYVM